MDKSHCPCGHDVEYHARYSRTPEFRGGCEVGICSCNLSQIEALRAAQRKAAALHLVRLRRARDTWRNIGHITNHFESVAHINGAVLAYRTLRVMRER